MAQMDTLAFEAAEEVFGNRVVVGVALAGHALPDAEFREALPVRAGSVLDAAVRMEDEAGQRLAALDSHVEGGEGKACVDAVGEGVANDLLCAKVFYDGTIEPALIGGDVGDVADRHQAISGLSKEKRRARRLGAMGCVCLEFVVAL